MGGRRGGLGCRAGVFVRRGATRGWGDVVVLAIGLPGDTAGLPGPLAARETAPRTRRPLSDLLLPAGPAPLLTAA